MGLLRTAVIGVGWMGHLHARAYLQSPLCELVAVADPYEARLKSVASNLGVKGYLDYGEMFRKEAIDAVSICTPDALHTEPVLAAARSGKHILVEKPLATSLEDCKKMIEAAKASQVKLMVAHILRFDPAYESAYQSVRRGDIGEIVQIYARRNALLPEGRQLAGKTSVLIFLGTHDIDVIRWIVGTEAKRVYGEANSVNFRDVGAQDSYYGLIRFNGGPMAMVENSWVLPASLGKSDMRLEIVGSKGAIYVDSYDMGFRLYTADALRMGDTRYYPISHDRVTGALVAEIDHFVDCVVNDKSPLITGEDGMAAVEIALAISESTETHQPVELPL